MLSKTMITKQVSVGTGIFGTGSANDASPLRISDADYHQGTFQVSIAGTASVTLFGRASPSMPWLQIAAPFTTSQFATVNILAEMYASVSAWTSGQVDAALNYPCNG